MHHGEGFLQNWIYAERLSSVVKPEWTQTSVAQYNSARREG